MTEKIIGYRELSDIEVELINLLKRESESTRTIIEQMRKNSDIDYRWVSIAETHMQQGYMALVRAIAQPESF